MTPPPQRPPLGSERLTELLEDAVRHVTPPGDALDRIRRGVRRRRTARRAAAVLLAVAVLAGGGSTALAVTSGRGPSGLAASANGPAAADAQDTANARATVDAPATADAPATRPTTADATTTAARDGQAPTSGRVLAPVPSPGSSGNLAAKAAAPPEGQASLGQPAIWDIDGHGQPDTATLEAVGNAQSTFSFQLVVHERAPHPDRPVHRDVRAVYAAARAGDHRRGRRRPRRSRRALRPGRLGLLHRVLDDLPAGQRPSQADDHGRSSGLDRGRRHRHEQRRLQLRRS